MSDPNNEERAERVYEQIDGYAGNDSLEECIIDVLTDIQHLCEMEQISFSDCCASALMHYREESK
jgi:hypothetical protein